MIGFGAGVAHAHFVDSASAIAPAALAGLLLAASIGNAVAAKAALPSGYCSPSYCEVCVEREHTADGGRCLKCAMASTALCQTKVSAPWTPVHYARAKDDVDVYNKPVEPRKVIGIMRVGSGTTILDYHPDGWCELDLAAFPEAHDGSGVGWIAHDHLEGCPQP
jgi:hypothetical protein